jgi:6-phosphofructokinase 2
VPQDFFARVIRLAKQCGAKTVIDTSGAALEAALEEGVTLIKTNLVELIEFIGRPLERDADYIAACRHLARAGSAQVVALTLGEDGALLVTADRAWRAQPLAIEVVSTVGAGDSFLSGLISALAAGQSIEQAFALAVAAVSAAVLTAGTGLCQAADVQRLLADVKIREAVKAVA